MPAPMARGEGMDECFPRARECIEAPLKKRRVRSSTFQSDHDGLYAPLLWDVDHSPETCYRKRGKSCRGRVDGGEAGAREGFMGQNTRNTLGGFQVRKACARQKMQLHASTPSP